MVYISKGGLKQTFFCVYGQSHPGFSAWAGAHPKPLQAYADMYASLGYATIQFGVNLNKLEGFNSLVMDCQCALNNLPILDIYWLKQLNLQSRKASQQSFWRKAERDLYAEAMSEKIEDFRSSCPDLTDRPFALQTFSNNGLQTWAQISHNFEHPKGRSTVSLLAALSKLQCS